MKITKRNDGDCENDDDDHDDHDDDDDDDGDDDPRGGDLKDEDNVGLAGESWVGLGQP